MYLTENMTDAEILADLKDIPTKAIEDFNRYFKDDTRPEVQRVIKLNQQWLKELTNETR